MLDFFQFQSKVFQVEINILQSSVIDTYDIYISIYFASQFQLLVFQVEINITL